MNKRLVPANPFTSVHPSAVPFEAGCSYNRNCETGRGIWQIGERYRRWQPAPEREYTFTNTSADEAFETAWVTGTAVAQAARGVSIPFKVAAYALTANDSAATSPMSSGQQSHKLTVTLGLPIADEVRVDEIKVRVRREFDPDDASIGTDYADDLCILRVNGVDEADASESARVPSTFQYQEYSFVGPWDGTDVNAGLAVDLGWIAFGAYSAGDFTVLKSTYGAVSATDSDPQSVSAEVTPRFVYDLTWTGSGPAPSHVKVQLEAESIASLSFGTSTFPTPPGDGIFTSAALADNGIGEREQNSSTLASSVVSASAGPQTITFFLPVAEDGTAQFDFTMAASASAESTVAATTGGLVCNVSCTETFTVLDYTPSVGTLKVDDVQAKALYTVLGSTTTVTVEFQEAQGIAYSDFNDYDRLAAVWGRGIFNVNGIYSSTSLGTVDHWSLELSERLLESGAWSVWVHDGKFFYAHPDGGVFYQPVDQYTVNELFRDSQSPGSTGDATYAVLRPPYIDDSEMDDAVDLVNGLHSARSSGGDWDTGSSTSTNRIGTAEVDAATKLATISGSAGPEWRGGWMQFEVIFASARDWEGHDFLGFKIEHRKSEDDSWGHQPNVYLAAAGLHQLQLEDADGTIETFTPQVKVSVESSGTYYYAYYDVTGRTGALDMSAIKEFRLRFGAQAEGAYSFRIAEILLGGTFYQDLVETASDADTSNMLNSIYAYRYYEDGEANKARKLSVPDSEWLGSKQTPSLPYLFSTVQVVVPVGDAPYTSAGKIELYRSVDGSWRLIEVAANTQPLKFEDSLSDSVIDPDTTTYPGEIRNERVRLTRSGTVSGGTFTLTFDGQTTTAIAWNASASTIQSALEALSNIAVGEVTLTGDWTTFIDIEFTGTKAETNVPDMTIDDALITGGGSVELEVLYDGCGEVLDFSNTTPSESGSVLDITFGCSWKGSNVYLGRDGKAYFSRTNAFSEVLWDNVVLTNDPGSTDLGPARTSVVPDNLKDPLVLAVPAENLYVATSSEVYVFVSGETAANSSYPRKIDGARGAIGKRAGCVYGDSALIGCKDGLWRIKKSTDYGEQPDDLQEVTKGIRGDWEWLLGEAGERLVVRSHFGDIWAFCEQRFICLTRRGSVIPGQWASGAHVHDAVSTKHGLLAQLEDGRMAVVGAYKTDGGTDLAGDHGDVPTWVYRTGQSVEPWSPLRAVVYSGGATGPSQKSATVKAITAVGDIQLSYPEVEKVRNKPFARFKNSSEPGSGFVTIEVSGSAHDEVYMVEIETVRTDWKRDA